MKALKINAYAHSGVLLIPVPKEFEEKELEIIILSTDQNASDGIKDDRQQKHAEKVERLMSIVGAAKYPDLPLTKYDVYEQ